MAIELSQLALRRWTEPTPMPDWQSMWPGRGNNIFDDCASKFGLALTWGLTHVDHFKEPEDPNESKKQAQSRCTAAAKATPNNEMEEHALLVRWRNTSWGVGFRGVPRGDEEMETEFALWRAELISEKATC